MAETFTATVTRGAEEVLQTELRQMGLQRVVAKKGIVQFMGPLKDGLKACLWSRIASRILLRLARFPSVTPDELYAGVLQIPWEDHLRPTGTLCVDFVGETRYIRNTHFGAQRTKDAVVDKLRNQGKGRPQVDKDNPDVRIQVHLRNGVATVSIDLSDRSLHWRTPGRKILDAPLKENLAATLLHLGNWPKRIRNGETFVDPMCGAGTLAIEAAAMAQDLAPGLIRKHWGFTKWLGHSESDWNDLIEEAIQRRASSTEDLPAIFAMDIEPHALEVTQFNAAKAGVSGITTRCQAVHQLRPPTEQTGMVVMNPPYGERLNPDNVLFSLYKSIGDVLKQQMAGWDAYIFAPANRLSKSVGLQTHARHIIHNGPMECRFLAFKLYK